VEIDGPFPFSGEVIWLTSGQGGRRSGPPPDSPSYAQLAQVPPHTAQPGSARFVLADFEPTAWRSSANTRWLIVANEGDQRVEAGDVVALTEGTTTVAFFIVSDVDG